MDEPVSEPVAVTVHIRRRPEIADPHGSTVRRALESLGHEDVTDVRLDRTIHLTLAGGERQDVERRVEDMCERLLANPVLEDYEVVVE